MTMKKNKAWIGDLLREPLISRENESSLSLCLAILMNKFGTFYKKNQVALGRLDFYIFYCEGQIANNT